jgi:hypothetical protein
MRDRKNGETMRDLPAILTRYRARRQREQAGYRAWNYALQVCKAWVKGSLGARSGTYADLQGLKTFPIARNHRTNEYWSPRDVKNILARLPDDVGSMCWTMATHGIGPKEMMHDGICVEGNGLRIKGQKNSHRDRIVPLVEPPAPVALTSYKNLLVWMTRASDGRMFPYDLRRCYPRWLQEAMVPYHRVKMYQGHAPQDQTDF